MSALRFSHIGVAVEDMDAAKSSYEDILGYHVTTGPFDDDLQEARVCFMSTEEPRVPDIELVAPLDESSHVNSFVAKGISAYHLCYRTADLDAFVEEVRAKRCLVVRPPMPALAFGGRRIAWFYMPNRQLVEVVEDEPR